MEGTPPERPERPMSEHLTSAPHGRRNPWPYVVALVVVLLGAGLTFVLLGGEDEAAGQTVRFQTPTEPGPDPFTRPADVRGKRKVEVGSGPFGGTGSDLVCDRELLVKSLRARPDRLRAWAETVGVKPTTAAVARYIRRLRPVTLTRDTRVTNHSFSNGRVVAFQAILQAGTAVLVDADGIPVARCRCGNPLAKPLDYVTATCIACPADYEPPPPCDRWRDCYRRYPNPPHVITYRRKLQCFPPRSQLEFERCKDAGRLGTDEDFPLPQDEPREPANVPGRVRFSPPSGTAQDIYTLEAGDFDPNIELTITLTRPDGVAESYSLRTDEFGNGSYTFPRAANPVLGTYRAVVTGGGETATASVTVREAAGAGEPAPDEPSQNPAGPEVGGGTDCNNPQSQDEIELCNG